MEEEDSRGEEDMNIEKMKTRLRDLTIGKDGILTQYFPMTTRVIAQYLIEELESQGEI